MPETISMLISHLGKKAKYIEEKNPQFSSYNCGNTHKSLIAKSPYQGELASYTSIFKGDKRMAG